jgi:hypothetical protein
MVYIYKMGDKTDTVIAQVHHYLSSAYNILSTHFTNNLINNKVTRYVLISEWTEIECKKRRIAGERLRRDRWRHILGAQFTGSGNAKERRIKNAKFQVLTASFLRSKVLWGKTFCQWFLAFQTNILSASSSIERSRDPDNKGTTLIQSVRTDSLNDKALYPRIYQAQEEKIVLSVVYDYLVY